MLTIDPRVPSFTIARATAWPHRNIDLRLTASTRSKSSSARSRKSQACVMPALLTRRSMRPWRSSVCCTRASTSALRETSARTNVAPGIDRGGRAARGLVEIGEHERRALGREALRAREADAARGAGDDGDAVRAIDSWRTITRFSVGARAYVTRRRARSAVSDRRTTRSTSPGRAARRRAPRAPSRAGCGTRRRRTRSSARRRREFGRPEARRIRRPASPPA